MKKIISVILLTLLIGCTALKPGADALVVRVEQTETIAKSTFDTVVHIDDSNRAFFATNAPSFHQFAEWLRADTGGQPRGIAMLQSLDRVKLSYKSAHDGSNDLVTALATVESALTEAQAELANCKK